MHRADISKIKANILTPLSPKPRESFESKLNWTYEKDKNKTIFSSPLSLPFPLCPPPPLPPLARCTSKLLSGSAAKWVNHWLYWTLQTNLYSVQWSQWLVRSAVSHSAKYYNRENDQLLVLYHRGYSILFYSFWMGHVTEDLQNLILG